MLLFSFTALSSSLWAAADTGLRREMIDASRKEALNIARAEVSGASLGEWKDIIDSSLFILFRRTELFRGQMRVLVIDNRSVTVKLYPDGTFVLSTGLLDYIDASLFESAADSPRRMRNFDSEREAVLVPFLATEAAHFALDHNFSAYNRSVAASGAQVSDANITASIQPSADEVLSADRFSVILLSLAGFDPAVQDTWLQSLEKETDVKSSVNTANPFADYDSHLPPVKTRLESLSASRDNILKITAEFSGVLASLRTGTAWDDAESSLTALGEIYPESLYLSRLEALVHHRQWLATVPADVQKLKTFFPIADEEDPSLAQFTALLAAPKPGFPSPAGHRNQTAIPGDNTLFINSLEAYNKTLSGYDDATLVSARAMLLVWTGNEENRHQALETAAEAAASEAGSDCITARANYASILYLTGTDYAKAQTLLSGLEWTDTADDSSATGQKQKKNSVLLDQGSPGDGRDIILNEALMLRSLGDTTRAQSKKTALEALMPKVGQAGTIALRNIHAGDSIDQLIAKWGRPAEIIYNYYTENWEYPSLSASILVSGSNSPDKAQTVRLVRLGLRSPVSPGGDIRCGDSRALAEAVFGKPSYRSGDCAVYFRDGNRLTVFYLSDKIRSISVGL